MGEGSEIPTDPNHTPIFIQPTKPQKTQKPRKPKRKDTKIPQSSGPTAHVADEVVYKERGDSLVRAATIASSLEAEQGSGNINKTRSKATPNEVGSQGTTSGGGPRRQDTMGDTIAQTRFENVSKISNDPLLARVLDLEKTKTSQCMEIDSLKRRVKRLERKGRSRTHKLKRLYKVGLTARVDSSEEEEVLGEDASKQGRIIDDIDDDEDITLVSAQDDADADMFDVNALAGVEESVEQEVAAKDVNLSVDEVTLAQALAALKSVKPKVKEPSVPVSAAIATTKVSVATTTTVIIPTPRKGIVITELGTSSPTRTIFLQQPSQAKVQDKGKGILVEPEKPLEKKDQINFDEETARKLQAKLMKRGGLQGRKMKPILQAEEQEKFTIEQKTTLFKELQEQRRKHFAAKRAEDKRNKPPTQAQQRKILCTYLKNIEGKKPKDLKNNFFYSIQKMFDRAFKRVNTFVDFRIDLLEGSSKRAGTELEQEIRKEGKKSYYQIIRADGKSQMYLVFSHMLKSFNREDLETLWKLVKAKYGSTRPVEDLDLILYGDLKTMFEPHVEDTIWRIQSDYRVLDWKLYDSCGVHSLRMQHMHIHMLVEKRYPLTPPTITDMLNKKLQSDHFGISTA
ncbi:hypothetical protein Tco_1250828 [Tanacetum coccineum]